MRIKHYRDWFWITSGGHVFSMFGKFKRVGSKNSYGYEVVTGRGQKVFLSHRAAYEAFIGPIEDGKMVLHRNGDKEWNAPCNLYLGDHKDNYRDMVRHTGHPQKKKIDRGEMRRLLDLGMSQSAVARRLGVTSAAINKIVRGIR